MNDTISIGTKVKLGKMVYVVTTVQDGGVWGVRDGMSTKPVDEFGSISGESFLGYPDEVSGFVVGTPCNSCGYVFSKDDGMCPCNFI